MTSLGRDFGLASWQVPALAALCVGAAVAFVMIERRAAEPILPLELFTQNVFVTTSIIGFISGAGMFGAITFLPLYLQISKGMTPTLSGLMLVPMTLGILTAANLAGRYMGRTGRYRLLPMIGTGLMLAGGVLLSTISRGTPLWLFGIYIAVMGAGMGCIFPVVTTAVQNAVPKAMLGTATAAGVMFRQIGGSLAVAAFGALFVARMARSMADAGQTFTGEIGPQMLSKLPEGQRDTVAASIVTAIHPVFWIVVGLAIAGFVVATLLKEVPLRNRMVPQGE